MRWNPEELVPAGKEERPLREALLKHYEITLLTKPLLQKAAEFSRDGLCELVGSRPEEELYAYLPGRDLLDLTRDFSLPGRPPGSSCARSAAFRRGCIPSPAATGPIRRRST